MENGLPHISEAEMEVLRALWDGGDWMSVGDVCAKTEQSGWKYKTVATFLLRLNDKGILESRKEGKTNYYRPLLTEEEYKRRETASFLEEVHGGSMKSLLAALYGRKADKQALDELEQWIRDQ